MNKWMDLQEWFQFIALQQHTIGALIYNYLFYYPIHKSLIDCITSAYHFPVRLIQL